MVQKNALYLKQLIEEIINEEIKPCLLIDNTSTICLIKSGNFSGRSKHIDSKYLFTCENFKKGLFNIEHCNTEEQLADMFTKALQANKFKYFVDFLRSVGKFLS